MARNNLTVVVKVVDSATNTIKKVNASLKDTGKVVKATGMDFTQFNKILFSATAYIGFFSKAFDKFSQSIEKAAELDRVSNQYERVFGAKGNLTNTLKSFTTTAVDRMTAMKASIALGSLGIAKNSQQAAEIIGMAATASKMAGKDTSEGVDRIVQSLKDGSLSGLEFLNSIRSADPVLKAHLELLGRAGGAIGGALTAQAKYNLILDVLRRTTRGHLKDQRDLVDVITDVKQSFSFLRLEIGRFLGSAIGPQIDKFSILADKLTGFIDRIRTTDKSLLAVAKNIIIVTAQLGGMLAAFGTLRLIIMGLGKLGVGGIPGLMSAFLLLGQTFGDASRPLDSLMDKLKAFGGVAAGAFQLASSFLMDPDNFTKGIGKIDKQLADFLRSKNLFGLTQNLGRIIATVGKFFKDVSETINHFVAVVTGKDTLIGKFYHSIMAMDPTPWKRKWIDSSNSLRTHLVNTAAVAVAAFAGFKVAKFGLSKIPIIKHLFDFGARPKGSRGDPIYTKSVDGISGGMLNSLWRKISSVAGGTANTAKGVLGAASAFTGVSGGLLLAGVGTAIAAAVISKKMMDKHTAGVLGEFSKDRDLSGILESNNNLQQSQKEELSRVYQRLNNTLTVNFTPEAFKALTGLAPGAAMPGAGAMSQKIGPVLAQMKAPLITGPYARGAAPQDLANKISHTLFSGQGHIKSAKDAQVPGVLGKGDLGYQESSIEATMHMMNKESADRMKSVYSEALEYAIKEHLPKLDMDALKQIISAGVDGSTKLHYKEPKHLNANVGGC